MNWLSKHIFIITPIGFQKRHLDIGQNVHFKHFSEKNLKFNFFEKNFMTFFNTVYKNCLILMEIEPRIL